MDIQQTDKESLSTYVHRFKREANRCKFDNDAATIRIFLKGLKNTHTIATKVYEKGPQTLTAAILEVEKLQAAQQLTSSLLPTSSVKVMTTDQEKCFQCQEVGHMARYCPHIKCYDCDNYGHVAMDCPNKIPPSGMPACCRSHRSSSRYHSNSSHSQHNTEDLDTVILDLDPAITATGVAAATPLIGIDPDQSIGLLATTSLETETPVPSTIVVTHPIADIPPVGIPPEMTADLTTGPDGNITNCPEDPHGNLKIENINKLQLTTCHLITIAQMTVIGAQMRI